MIESDFIAIFKKLDLIQGRGDEEGNPQVNSYPKTKGVRKPGYVFS